MFDRAVTTAIESTLEVNGLTLYKTVQVRFVANEVGGGRLIREENLIYLDDVSEWVPVECPME